MITESIAGTTFRKQPSFDELETIGTSTTSNRGMRSVVLSGWLVPDPENPYDPQAVQVLTQIAPGSDEVHMFGFAKRGSLVHVQQQLQPFAKPVPCVIYCEYFSDIHGQDYNDSYHYCVDEKFIANALGLDDVIQTPEVSLS